MIIGISSKKDVDDRVTQMNLYKLVDLDYAPKLVAYGKAVFEFNLPGWTTISFKNGSIIWNKYDSNSYSDVFKHLQTCPSNAFLDEASNRCKVCPNEYKSFYF